MSIFNKVVILFLISFSLMIYLSNSTNQLTQRTIETLLKDKYIQASDELFKYLSNNDKISLNKKLKELQFKIIRDRRYYLKSSTIAYEYNTELSSIKILKAIDGKYLLYMKYLDDEVLSIDLSQDKNFEDKEFLNYMILADILILITLFLIILKTIYPLKKISKSIKKFGDGNYSLRIENFSNDEIGEVSKTFNSMALNIEDLINSRERLLRDIGHELKTPITKSKLAIEMIEDSKYKKILNKALSQIDEMISELLYLEKLNSNQSALHLEKFNVETLISESLSKLFIDDEQDVDVSIENSFDLYADLNYLSIALKNLIDNALKYGTKKPIFISVNNKQISIKSKGNALEKPLEFYCEAFVQGDNSRNKTGHGLGLSIVKIILEKHKMRLDYNFFDGFNIFSINGATVQNSVSIG